MAHPQLPTRPCICPAPGLVWMAGGLPAPPGGMAARRNTALFAASSTETSLPSDFPHGAREVTLLPAELPHDVIAFLPLLRAAAPDAVLRLEWWLEADGDVGGVMSVLRAAQPLYVHAVVTAPEQIAVGFGIQVQRLLDSGVPVAAELLLRRGGIETLDAVRSLCLGLLKLGVRPYVLVDAAWLPGAERMPRDIALKIVRGLRGWISGLAVPQLVEESGAGVRTPVIPAYVRQLDDAGVEVVNYEGRRLHYANPPEKPE